MHWTYCNTSTFSECELQQAYQTLSPSRKAHIDSLRSKDAQLRSLTATLLVQRLLQEHDCMESAVLCRNAQGQPFLSCEDLYVSISHCDHMVACAISEAPVGIDIQRIRPIDLKLCRHVCQEEEAAYVLGNYADPSGGLCQAPDVLRRFFEIWTAKEAYFKKAGTGITNLRSVNVLQLPRQTQIIDNYMLQIL